MIVIADSNIIVSALIKPTGRVASIFKEKSNIQFIAPDFLLLRARALEQDFNIFPFVQTWAYQGTVFLQKKDCFLLAKPSAKNM